MKNFLIYCLSIILYTLNAHAESVTLAWDPSSDETNGLVASYKAYTFLDGVSVDFVNVGLQNSVLISNLMSQTEYSFRTTSVGTNNLESDFSNEVFYTTPGELTNQVPLELQVNYLTDGTMLLFWPSNQIGIIQYTTNLSTGIWQDYSSFTNGPVLIDTKEFAMAFFRFNRTNPPIILEYLIDEQFEGEGYELAWLENGSASFNPDYPFNGGDGLNIAYSSQSGRVIHEIAPHSELHFYCKINAQLIQSTKWVLNFANGAENLCQFRILANGRFYVRAGDSGGSYTSNSYVTNQTYHVWGSFVSGPSSFGSIAFSTDGVKPVSGANYAEHFGNAVTNSIDSVVIGDAFGAGSSTASIIWDDLLVDEIPVGDQ